MIERSRRAGHLGSQSAKSLALLAYGGGGGILLPTVGARMGMARVLLPRLTAMFSAFGVCTFDVSHRYEQRVIREKAASSLRALVDAAKRDIRGEGFSTDRVSLVLRVLDEEGTLLGETRLPVDEFDGDPIAGLPGQSAIILSLSATVSVAKPGLPSLEKAASQDASEALKKDRSVLCEDGVIATPVYDWDRLKAGHIIHGPALVESPWATYLVPPLCRSQVDDHGTSVVELEGGQSGSK
jgi:N-methylhydantoinase A